MNKFLCLALVAVASACTTTETTKSAATPISPAELQAKWEAYATPGAAHHVLDQKTGNWNLAVTMFMAPGAEPIRSTGTCELKWILDDRYVQDITTGEAAGQQFHGQGVIGFDNIKKKYVSTWIDNMSTGVMTGEGTYDASRKLFTYTTYQPDVVSGSYTKGRATERFIDKDHWVMQSFVPDANGDEYMSMEIHYTRAN
jgi:hypothetical protein